MNKLLVLLILSFLCVCFIYFLLWSLLFPSTNIGLCSFSSVFMCNIRLLIWDFLFLKVCVSLWTASAATHWYCTVVFPFSFLSTYFFISSLIWCFLWPIDCSIRCWLVLHVYLTLFRRELNCLATKVLKVVSITKTFVGTLNPRVAGVLH